MEKFFENFYDLFFSPDVGLERIKKEVTVRQAAAVVAFVAVFLFLFRYDFSSFGIFSCVSGAILSALGAAVIWFLFCSFINGIYMIFFKESKIHQLLSIVGFVGLVWIFMAPLGLLKAAGGLGYAIAVVLQIALAVYIMILYVKAVACVCDITLQKAFALVSIPLLGSFFAVVWTIGFFVKMFYIFSV